MKKTKKLVMSWLLAFCCVITLVAPSVVNAAADDFIKFVLSDNAKKVFESYYFDTNVEER